MELKVFKDTLSTVGSPCEAKAELPIETEILIPDYLPQVFKIIKCFVHPVILQKQAAAGRCTLDGYLRCTVFYQAETDASLCQTEQKLPFTKTIDLPGLEAGGGSVQAAGDLEYLNCRAVNQRRVEVRGAYALLVSVAGVQEQELITTLSGAGAEQQLVTLSGMRSLAAIDKLMTAEEELTFPQPPQAVLDISGAGTVQDVKLISGKAVVKGEIAATVVYRAEAGYRTEQLKKAVPFNQIVDLDGLTEDCQCFAAVEPVGCTLMAGMAASGPEAASVNTLSVTALLHLRVLRPVECCVVNDAFSTEFEADVSYKTVALEQLATELDATVEAHAGGALPDENAEILECFATLAPLELTSAGEALALRGRATAHVFCMNSLGEIDCYDKSFEYTLPGQYSGLPGQYRLECWPTVLGIGARKNGGELDAAVSIRVAGLLMQRQTETVVDTVTCEQPLEPEDPAVALRIYYAAAGEDVFAIAKHYHVSPGAMLTANHLESPQLAEDTRLLVPMNA